MATYAYAVRDASGALHKGQAEAETIEILRNRLKEQGFEVQDLKAIKGKRKSAGFGRIKLNDLALFCRQFSTMMDAGVSLIRSMDVLSRQNENPKLRRVLVEVGERIEGGETLSRALARYPKAFSNLFVGLVRAGEVSGTLEESLQRLSQFLESDVALRRKVKAAMTYPVIVVVVALSIVMGLVMFVVPSFFKLFSDLGMREEQFPATTKFLVDLSHFLTSKWWVVIIAIIIFVMAYKAFANTTFGRRTVDRLKLKMPVFGKLHHRICLARFSRTLGTLMAAGVPILQAMETVAGMLGNAVLADAILEARARIREGDRIGVPLEKSKMFPPMVVHMIGVGEESGSLDFMLQKIADYYEAEVEAMLASLTAAIEPLLIVVLGFMVGFIVISMFAPMLSVITELSK
ncbi:MAG: type II secretion system F family protein [bacterium]